MKDIDWNIIFKLKEFIEYIFNHDLIQLSMSCKKLRQYLIKNFKTLNFYLLFSSRNYINTVIKEDTAGNGIKNFHCINPYKSLNKELAKYKKQFSNDLKIFNRYTKNLILTDSKGCFYLLYELPNLFTNITALVINNLALTMEVLQQLFNRLKYLERLDLTENVIFKDAEISNEYSISYPISLRSLKLGENGVIMVQDKFNPIGIRSIKQDSSGTYEFNGTYQHLPNLATFDYDMSYDYPEENGDLFQFILLNPQLKCLKLSGLVFNYDLFDIIKDLESLTHLVYNCDYMNEDLENYEMPVLHNINYLHLNITSNAVYNMMKGKFPNLIELVKEIEWSIDLEKENLIENFANVKILKFTFNCYNKDINEFTLPKLKYLESLEINLNFKEEKFKYFKWDVSACDKLKLITFTKNEFYTLEKFELNQELSKHWSLFYFPHKLVFRKNY